jgi:hypothetical protein
MGVSRTGRNETAASTARTMIAMDRSEPGRVEIVKAGLSEGTMSWDRCAARISERAMLEQRHEARRMIIMSRFGSSGRHWTMAVITSGKPAASCRLHVPTI